MNEEQARAMRDKCQAILDAKEHLRRQQELLDRVNKRVKAGSTWKVDLLIDKDLPYGYRELSYTVPLAHVQQQLVDRVGEARRRLILLGGEP